MGCGLRHDISMCVRLILDLLTNEGACLMTKKACDVATNSVRKDCPGWMWRKPHSRLGAVASSSAPEHTQERYCWRCMQENVATVKNDAVLGSWTSECKQEAPLCSIDRRLSVP